ncbi:MAG: amidinotransferase [Candidatus Harrisonbacteria bacterium]|nr:amidinotransferase [Candidatus Harrisonbacteria bacterium]
MLVIRNKKELAAFDLGGLGARRHATGVLMCTPEHFDVIDVKNFFMQGFVGRVDCAKAVAQWKNLRGVFQKLGLAVKEIAGVSGLEDMVFSANSGIAWQGLKDARPSFLASAMFHESRQRETPRYETWFRENGFQTHRLASGAVFEGGGDAIWYPGKMLLLGGYGHRTTLAAYREVSERFNIPVIALRLASKEFYHLDTCLCILNNETALYCPAAFDRESNKMICAMFPNRMTFTKAQGKKYFTGNAFAVCGKHVVLQQGDKVTVWKLRAAGFSPIEVDMGEYIKSGGNVTCVKLDIVA